MDSTLIAPLSFSKLPRKWLNVSWVENFSSVRQDQQGGIATIYNTDAIDKADLYLWIRENRFQQATPKDFRLALRQMCREKRPGYKASPLNPVLRQMLVDRITSIGKRLWPCQLVATRIENDNACGKARLFSTQSVDAPPRKRIALSNSVPATHTFQPSLGHARHWMLERASSVHSSAPSKPTNTLQSPLPNTMHETVAAISKQPQRNMPNAKGMGKGSTRSIGFEIMDTPLDDEILRIGLVEFGFDYEDMRDEKADGEQQQGAAVVRALCPSFDTLPSLLPQIMSDEHLAQFYQVTALLQHRQMNDVPARYFTALEHHFTRCFSRPNAMSFVIKNNDRFITGKPDVYANQQAEELFSVGLTQVQHVIMGIDSTRRVAACVSQAAEMNSVVAYVPGVWANTRDKYGNPCARLVDMWLPRIIFNGTSFMVIIAPHGSVSLERNFEVFQTPSHPPYSA